MPHAKPRFCCYGEGRLGSGRRLMFKESKIPGFNADDFVVKQVFYNSKDGTRVPMTILHKKGIALDSSHPCFMYGYGGFAISLTPTFVNMALGSGPFVFLKHFGGVLAYPNLRGGAEYGENWHQAGVGVKKQNVFDDFIAAAKYLRDNGYTTSRRLTICGSSNGGFLVGACTNQAPERFGCTILQIGVTDLIRFPENTIGKMIVGELGDPAVKEQFDALIKVSPLHNIRVPQGDVQYPAVLVQTGDHDDRCPPGMHSYKYTSEIQHTVGNQAKQTNPLMLSVEKDAGHLVGKSTEKRIAEITDIYSFMAQTTNLQWND